MKGYYPKHCLGFWVDVTATVQYGWASTDVPILTIAFDNTINIIFFQQDKDKFGNDITYLARPLPVEYLIIDVSIHMGVDFDMEW